MNRPEERTFIKDTAVSNLNLTDYVKVGDYEFVMPITVEGNEKTQFARITITACDTYGTKINQPFTLEDAIENYNLFCAKREQDKAEKIAAKAEKEAKAKSKK